MLSSAAAGARGRLCSGESGSWEASWRCARVRSMLPCSVLRHAGWRPAQCHGCIVPRRAGWCSAANAPTGAQGARRRAWHGRRERRGCRSTPRRMGAAEAARQAAGIAAAKAPALCFAFARVLRQLSVYHSRRTLPRCFFIGASQLRILVLSSSSCVGAVRILVSVVSVVSTSSE